MARKIQPETIRLLNEICRFIHFDPRVQTELMTRARLANRLDMSYPNLLRIMNDKRFVSVFDEDPIGRVALTGIFPAFLEGMIDLESPYTAKPCTCGCRSNGNVTGGVTSANPQKPKQPAKKFQTKHYSAEVMKQLLSKEGADTLDILLRMQHVDTRSILKDPHHIFWQIKNMADALTVIVQLLSDKDPAKKAVDLIDDPDKFPPLNTILGSKTDKTETVAGEIRVLGQTISRDKIKEAIEVCHTKSRLDGYKNPDNDNRTVYYYELAKELEKYV